jgi:catechol 2,3-dioxygenase-like lactoylglutathione lyase family enzyme
MKINVEGVSELVLEVQSMETAIDFWSNKLGFPIVSQWGNGLYDEGGVHVHFALYIKPEDETVSTLKALNIDITVRVNKSNASSL